MSFAEYSTANYLQMKIDLECSVNFKDYLKNNSALYKKGTDKASYAKDWLKSNEFAKNHYRFFLYLTDLCY